MPEWQDTAILRIIEVMAARGIGALLKKDWSGNSITVVSSQIANISAIIAMKACEVNDLRAFIRPISAVRTGL